MASGLRAERQAVCVSVNLKCRRRPAYVILHNAGPGQTVNGREKRSGVHGNGASPLD